MLIVDDEPLARDRLRGMLQREPNVDIIGECDNGPDALTAIRRQRPEVVFLDVQMPGCDGLKVVNDLGPELRPAIVFVTAYDRFAVDAFAVQAVDYLLKPFDRDRLHAAVERVREYLRAQRAGQLGATLENLLADATAAVRKTDRLTIKADGRVVFLKPSEILWIKAADNYVIFHLVGGERLTVRETLSALEERLGATHFARVNRSAIVNLDRVKELQPTFHGDYTVVLHDGTRLPLSRSLRGSLEKFLSPGH